MRFTLVGALTALATLTSAALAQTLPAATPAPAPAPQAAPAPPPTPQGTIDVVTYVEVTPAWTSYAIGFMRKYRDAARAEPGAVHAEIYQGTGRAARFVINETWKDWASYQAHAATSKLAEMVKPGHIAPPDVRAHTEWSVGTSAAPNANAIYGFTHIDVAPPGLPTLMTILKPYIEASRAEKGALRFDLLQGAAPRLNHETLAEAWASEAAFRAHQSSATAIEFRDKLAPLLGALYDQRLYRWVK